MTRRLLCYLVLLVAVPSTLSAAAQEVSDAVSSESTNQETQADGWFRIDTDILETQLWVGATYDVGAGLGLASDIYVVGDFAELDVGVAFSLGPVALLPMAGIGFDFGDAETTSLIAPQLFTIVDVAPVYFESWIQVFFNDLFVAGATDSFYTRNFLLFQALDVLAVGPQMELTYELNNASEDELASLPVGGRINASYGENNTLGLFLGYETQTDGNKLAGRFTFVRTW